MMLREAGGQGVVHRPSSFARLSFATSWSSSTIFAARPALLAVLASLA